MSGGPPGTQVVTRVADILRVVSQMMPDGAGTREIATLVGLTRPTAHRLLTSLTNQGLVDRDSDSGRWMLGPEIFLMGV
ncbi:helix-turn-helix domain-containing protein, partial [uncultured Corynebacterium sp.]|uniref:helix-turn-helix domain-containing protein n=1 Tax=uncultured Corynebacterium sp. TaxID=159447 RepID=UPI0025EB3273